MRVTASRLRRMRFDSVDAIFFRFDGSRPIGGVDAASRHHLAPDQRDVLLLDLPLGELAGQFLVRGVVLGDHHQPRRAAVEAMDDARAASRRRCR